MAHQFSSPKRKRGAEADIPHLQTSALPRFSLDYSDNNVGDESPRTHVASRFHKLNLDHDEQRQDTDSQVRGHKRLAKSTSDPRESSPCPQRGAEEHRNGVTGDLAHQQQDVSVSSSPGKGVLLLPAEENKRPKSPSLGGEISDHYWHESEITGHDPDDPTDDGYGINGIGFRPTPAIAYARSQKRKQQLAEYRSRETREARQKRSERRRGGSGDGSHAASNAVEEVKKAKVKFDDG